MKNNIKGSALTLSVYVYTNQFVIHKMDSSGNFTCRICPY